MKVFKEIGIKDFTYEFDPKKYYFILYGSRTWNVYGYESIPYYDENKELHYKKVCAIYYKTLYNDFPEEYNLFKDTPLVDGLPYSSRKIFIVDEELHDFLAANIELRCTLGKYDVLEW